MAATERTPLTRPTDPPTYIEFAGLVRARRTKLRQFQCCVCAFVLSIFIMALVVTVSLSINEMDPLVADSTNPEVVPETPSLQSSWSPGSPNLQISNEIYPTSLTADEYSEGTKAGQEAINQRQAADSMAIPLPSPSPNSRHQYAVKTSLQAGKLALGGIGELAATRKIEQSRTKLGASSSVGTYFKNLWVPAGTCKEFTKFICPPSKYRNFDGTCNHPKNLGSAMSPFLRKLPANYADGVDSPRIGKYGKPLPSAREISLKVHPPAPSENPSFTVMLAVFGQFLDHDITATAISQGTNGSSLSCCPAATHQHPECFPVQVGPGDPVYDVAGRDCMEFVRSAPAPQCKIGPREQLNQVTSFIDASVIYGPDLATAQSLREGEGGALRMFKTPDNRTLLPQSTDPNDGCNREVESARGRYCFASGDGRSNENLHLTTMHVLWARQHNRIAAKLAEINPTWSDEEIFQETRRIIGAQLQHITYKEFVPIVLGEKEVALRKLKPFKSGYRPRNDSTMMNPSIANSFASAAFRFAHTLLPGLMKVTDSEKSTSSYVELHRMLFNPYSLYSKGGMETSLNTATSNLIQKTTTHVTSQLTKHLFEDPLANKTIPCGLDLVSLNIQRGRDHGLPGYNNWRQYCGLNKVSSFSELAGEIDPEALNEISKIYNDVDDVDLYTGALAETNKADGLVGPTFRCIIGDQFERLQKGDRFWYEVPGERQSFTEEQLTQIRKTSLAKLICDCSDGITQVQPEVMRSIGPGNPMTSCEDIAELDLTAWKDASTSPILKAKPAADLPETWLKFKTEINDTVQQIVDFFGKTVPPPGSPDWTNFKDWINKSFTDVRNDVAALHPKPIESLNAPSILTLLSDTEPKVNPEKPPKKSKFNYMQFVVNRTLVNVDKYSKTAVTQPTTYEDWITFKSDIKKTLNDALVKATGKPTAEQRKELEDYIVSEIADIKNQIAAVKSAKLYLAKAATAKDPAAVAAWLNFKKDIMKSVTDAVDRIKGTAPVPGDPSWATYGLDIKNQFASLKDHIPVLPSTKLMAKDPTIAAYWDNFGKTLNQSINNAVVGLDEKIATPEDPAWAAFGADIKNNFIGFKDKFAPLHPTKPMEKAVPAGTVMPFDWIGFKTDLVNSIADTVGEIKKNMPPPGSTAWAAYKGQIINGFAKIPSKTPIVKLTASAPTTKETDDPSEIGTFDWAALVNEINKTVSDIISTKNSSTFAPTDAAKWAAFGAKFAKFNKTFDSIKSEIDTLRPKPAESEFLLLTNDWIDFKEKINKSLTDTIDSIKANASAPSDAGWVAFKDTIKNEFAALKNEIATAKFEASTIPQEAKVDSAKEAQYWPELPADLFSLQAKANKTLLQLKKSIADMKLGATAPVISAADWIAFKQEFKDIVTNFASVKNVSDVEEWKTLKDSVKKSFDDLRNEVASLKNTTGVLQEGSGSKVIESLKGKKDKKTVVGNETLFDWEKLKTDINATVQNLLDDLGKIVPKKEPAKTLKESLVKAQKKFVDLQFSPSLTTQEILPDNWAVFVNGINKTLSSVMKKINTLKPVDKTDTAAIESYEKEVNDFFEEVKQVVERKKSEFAALTSMASSLGGNDSRFFVIASTIIFMRMVAVF